MLHTIMNSPTYSDFISLLSIIDITDEILLLQDGVITAIDGNLMLKKILNINFSINIWVLEEDLIARGLIKQLSDKIMITDYIGFVNLTLKHQQQMVW
ncbi:MAG: sulfurtransferase complex subunit TusB [Pantoea sp. Brub]|nr:sulfurtransferase complex subunit TusB [Pantoea sp. Brub]